MAIDVAAVQLLIGDTDETYITTEQIETLATLYGDSVFVVAAAAARAIAAQFAASVTKRAGDVSINASDKYKHYSDLARQLESKAAIMALGSGGAYAGGISKSDKARQGQDTDRVEPYFTRALHDDLDGDRQDEYRYGYP